MTHKEIAHKLIDMIDGTSFKVEYKMSFTTLWTHGEDGTAYKLDVYHFYDFESDTKRDNTFNVVVGVIEKEKNKLQKHQKDNK